MSSNVRLIKKEELDKFKDIIDFSNHNTRIILDYNSVFSEVLVYDAKKDTVENLMENKGISRIDMNRKLYDEEYSLIYLIEQNNSEENNKYNHITKAAEKEISKELDKALQKGALINCNRKLTYIRTDDNNNKSLTQHQIYQTVGGKDYVYINNNLTGQRWYKIENLDGMVIVSENKKYFLIKNPVNLGIPLMFLKEYLHNYLPNELEPNVYQRYRNKL